MGIYVGVNGTPKEVTAVYVGVNGVPKECSDIYVGVNGTPKSCYSGVKPGETIFTSSTTFTVPKGVKKIDAFCVGGGGYGGNASYTYDSSVSDIMQVGGGGGGGGYTTTKLGVGVTPGQQLSVSVGVLTYGFEKSGSSSVGDICSAKGGKGGTASSGGYVSFIGGDGGSGGSGGGGGPVAVSSFGFSDYTGGKGGTDGGDGNASTGTFVSVGGAGQHKTTRYFGESNGTLYASGGDGGVHENAGGSNGNKETNGQGVVIIRWTKDYFK